MNMYKYLRLSKVFEDIDYVCKGWSVVLYYYFEHNKREENVSVLDWCDENAFQRVIHIQKYW